MPKRSAEAIAYDPSKLEEYIGALVKKLFQGYGEFSGFVSKVDKKAKDGMPIHIEYEDGDKGWMTFKEFSEIVQRDAAGNLKYEESKRKTKPASQTPAPPSKRSKKTPTPVEAPRGRSSGRASGRFKSSQENVTSDEAAAAATSSGAADGDAIEPDVKPAANGDTAAAPSEPIANGEAQPPVENGIEAKAEPDAHVVQTLTDAAKLEAAEVEAPETEAAETEAADMAAAEPEDAEMEAVEAEPADTEVAEAATQPVSEDHNAPSSGTAEAPAGELPEVPNSSAAPGIAQVLEHIQQTAQIQEDQADDEPQGPSTSGEAAEETEDQLPPTAPTAFTPATGLTTNPYLVSERPPEPPLTCPTPTYPNSLPARPPTPPRPLQQLAKYSQVVVHNGLVYISGQVPKDVSSFSGCTYYGQTQQVLNQLDELMLSVGVTKKRLLQVRIYLKNMANGREDFNRAWLEWVDQDALPARTMIEAKMVRESILVQIEATAAMESN